MNITTMTKSDLESVQVLGSQLGYGIPFQQVLEKFHRISQNPDYALMVAKSDEGAVLGWIQINKECMSLLVGEYADVAALVVHEQARGQGIGKELLKKAEAWAAEKKIKTIRVRSNTKRTEAHRFYQREGYELSKTSNIFYKQLLR